MALTIKLTPGAVVTENDLWTVALLNLLANPTIELEGSVGTLALADGSVTLAKLIDGVLAASTAGRAKMADGFVTLAKILDGSFTADAAGRAKFGNGFLTAVLLEETVREGVAQYGAGIQGATVYAVALSPAATGYTEGMVVRFKADSANVGGVSVNVNGLGAKALVSSGLVALTVNEIAAGQVVTAVYDGTQFQMVKGREGRFVSAEFALAAGVIGNVAHGLGETPKVQWVLKCVTDDSAATGYVVGDEIDVNGTYEGGTGVTVFTGGANGTNVFLLCDTAVTSIKVRKKTDGSAQTLTTANWKAKAYARV